MAQRTKEILEEILEKKLEPIVKSVEFMSERFDNILKRLTTLEKEKKDAALENQRLQSECFNIANDLKHLKQEMNNLEQYSRRDCLEIQGIPPTKDENPNALVQRVGKLVGVEVHDYDISISHRIPRYNQQKGGRPTNTRDPGLIVKFTRREVRDRFFLARKNLRDKTTRDLGLMRTNESKIYISESLTRKNKSLFNRCLQAKRDLKYRFIWTSHGRILLRKDGSSPAICIQSDDDLKKIYDADTARSS